MVTLLAWMAQRLVSSKTHKVGLTSLLKSHHRRALKAQVSLEILSNLTDQPLERQLADEQLCGLLVPPDLPESNCTRPVAVGLLDTPSCRCRLTCCLGRQLLPGCLSTGRLPGSLLGPCHCRPVMKL